MPLLRVDNLKYFLLFDPYQRGSHSVLKLAWTIADLAGSEVIAANRVAEAVQYRPRMGM
jgi:predicted ATPase with chaperone activity